MQSADAYVQQVPAGARPPMLRSAPPGGRLAAAKSPPAGLYVQVADVRSQAEAVRASLALAERLGSARPAFIRGVAVQAVGGSHILMYGGPFGDAAAARAFCAEVLASGPCLARTFARTPVVSASGATER